jgi:alginate O-acetyltransferase complex protein AlgI
MLFNSPAFALFFPVVVILYFMLGQDRRWILLLAASCYFYMYFIPRYILILGTTILVDYFAAIYIEENEGRRRRSALIVSIVLTCLILAIFKYASFIAVNASWLLKILKLEPRVASPHAAKLYGKMLAIILPIGLSFHTFQSLSYVIEVYRGNQKAERHFGIYALYVMFFPQLVAGPIERPQNLLHQFRERHALDFERIRSGLLSIATGLFLKVVIADRLAVVVNRAYDDPGVSSGLSLLIATLFFAFQIYCDFSGYSLIAIGSAEVLGITLIRNFRRPYLATSISEFWQRWHISLSTWFKDYVYIPLGGSKAPYLRWQFNLIITFLISGLWHGAKWTYVAWGGLNGLYLVAENVARARFGNLSAGTFVGRVRTFALIMVSWVLFRSKDIGTAWSILKKMTTFAAGAGMSSSSDVAWGFVLIAGLLVFEAIHEESDVKQWLLDQPRSFRWAAYYAAVAALFAFGVYGSNQFIYFQF